MTLKPTALAAMALASVMASPASAHHSGAMFDREKMVTLTGTLREYQFANPHSWILVDVPDAAGGKSVVWSVEAPSPWVMTQAGITPSKLKPGDKITVTAHPLRDGRAGAGFVSVTLANGQVLKRAPPSKLE